MLGMRMFDGASMTTVAAIIITMLCGGGLAWFIRGMADRKRADNESVTTLSGAHDALFKSMQTAHDVQFKNMQLAHEVVVGSLQREVARLSEIVTNMSIELNTVKTQLDEERRARLGEIKNAIQVDLAASALIEGKDK